MRKTHFIIYIVIFLNVNVFAAESTRTEALEKEVYELNNALNYKAAQEAVHRFLTKNDLSNEERYFAHLYMSYIFKRLFDYTSVVQQLDKALVFGLQTDKKDYFEANIICQKALVFFDTRKYAEADSLMRQLALSNYQFLDDEYKSKIAMQEAYLLFKEKKYGEAEKKYEKAEQLMYQSSPCDLPMIYGKRVELDGEMKRPDALKNFYDLGERMADSCGIIKYKMYMKEMMYTALNSIGLYKESSTLAGQLINYLTLYNHNENAETIRALEQKHQNNLKDFKIKEEQRRVKFLWGIVGILGSLIVLLTILYSFVQKQKRIISKQNDTNTQLVSIISHDIKEPLLGIRILLKKLKIQDPYLAQASLGLENQLMVVNDILNNLLNIRKSNLEKDNEELGAAEISNVIQEVIQSLQTLATAKNLRIEVNISPEPNCRLIFSRSKLYLILYNIISNAIKYSYENKVINIFNVKNTLFIRDYGVGVTEEQAKFLMKEVMQSQKGTYNELGNGLGLYLVGQLIKGAKINVEVSPAEVGTLVKISC